MKTQDQAKNYTLNVAKMLAGKASKTTGEKHIPVNVGEDKWVVMSESAIAAKVAEEAKQEQSKKDRKPAKVLYVATLPLAEKAFNYTGWVGAVEPNGRVTWFDSKVCRVHAEDKTVTVKVPYAMTRARKSVQWEIEELAA